MSDSYKVYASEEYVDQKINEAMSGGSGGDLPEGGAVPIVYSATVGQSIVVKSVDDMGKPTEWETIDPWVITSPNGTQFKLTIDDEGILSAAELV